MKKNKKLGTMMLIVMLMISHAFVIGSILKRVDNVEQNTNRIINNE